MKAKFRMHPLIYGFLLGFITVFIATLIALLLMRRHSAEKRTSVVVLGDIGRSPRMQYHCLSLARHGFSVDFIGYGGSSPHEDLLSNRNIKLHHLKEPPQFPRLLIYIFKSLWQIMTLSVMMLRLKKPSHVLLQNPPAIPSLFVLNMVCFIRDCPLVVDWHNYGYTILGLALGNSHPLVRFSKRYEAFFGKLGDSHICVTAAMKNDLQEKWNIVAETVYDRPPSIFKPIDIRQKHRLFTKLSQDYDVFRPRSAHITDGSCTMFTQRSDKGKISHLDDRPALLISSTSWTEDEDFSILLNALQEYESTANKNKDTLPSIVCVITGKGPLKEYYKKKIDKLKFSKVMFCLPWLEAEDYPKLLGCADLGVCLHMSSSGLDLPMKVVDMFGCGLPVCAIDFKCISELVVHEKNGMVFKNHTELASQIQGLLTGFPHNQNKLELFRDNLQDFQDHRWDDNWNQTVLPLFS